MLESQQHLTKLCKSSVFCGMVTVRVVTCCYVGICALLVADVRCSPETGLRSHAYGRESQRSHRSSLSPSST